MKFFAAIVCVCLMLRGCSSNDVVTVLAVADAGIKTEASIELQAGNQDLTGYLNNISSEEETLQDLYKNFYAAVEGARPGIAGKIEAVVLQLAADDQKILALAGVKNQKRLVIIQGIIAAVEAGVVVLQDKIPAPSGNSVQLNSTVAQMKAAVAK